MVYKEHEHGSSHVHTKSPIHTAVQPEEELSCEWTPAHWKIKRPHKKHAGEEGAKMAAWVGQWKSPPENIYFCKYNKYNYS